MTATPQLTQALGELDRLRPQVQALMRRDPHAHDTPLAEEYRAAVTAAEKAYWDAYWGRVSPCD